MLLGGNIDFPQIQIWVSEFDILKLVTEEKESKGTLSIILRSLAVEYLSNLKGF
jgi:hypothetical protein